MRKKSWLALLCALILVGCSVEDSPGVVLDSALTNLEQETQLETMVLIEKDDQKIYEAKTHHQYTDSWNVQFSNEDDLNHNDHFKQLCRMDFLADSFNHLEMENIDNGRSVSFEIAEDDLEPYQDLCQIILATPIENVNVTIEVNSDSVMTKAYLSLNQKANITIERIEH